MTIEHLAIWTKDIEKMKAFYLEFFAIALGSKQLVDDLTHTLRVKGYSILGEPRTTGDGYYESVIADPEGNQIELTI